MSLQVISIACDWGAGQPGGAAGVHSWYAIAINYKHLAWIEAEHIWLSPATDKPVWIENGRHVYARRLDPWAAFAEVVRETFRKIPLEGRSLILTGDHSWAGCILPVLAERLGKVGVVWIDAHADFHNPATSPSGNLHGMPLAMATGLNQERIHPVPNLTWEIWNRWVQPAIMPENLILIGLRSHEPPEMELIQKHGIVHFSAMDVMKGGLLPVVEAIRSLEKRVDVLYVSFDVDVWDPSFARGTGSAAPGGLNIAQIRMLFQEIISLEKFRFLEVTEINPLLDRDNQTALYAYGTVRPFIDGQWDERKLFME
ncbi:MAG: arginase family protein [Bacteroidia bacterium]|nr:arginase family protein [Bacteroidia bacterium]MCX7764400.1 arginase family protein [Bacteroidia bacterium]MDW8056687.1 arginase family protein [Bacteroidia bacterium]